MMTHFFLKRKVKETKCNVFPQKHTGNIDVNFSCLVKSLIVGFSSDDEMMMMTSF